MGSTSPLLTHEFLAATGRSVTSRRPADLTLGVNLAGTFPSMSGMPSSTAFARFCIQAEETAAPHRVNPPTMFAPARHSSSPSQGLWSIRLGTRQWVAPLELRVVFALIKQLRRVLGTSPCAPRHPPAASLPKLGSKWDQRQELDTGWQNHFSVGMAFRWLFHGVAQALGSRPLCT